MMNALKCRKFVLAVAVLAASWCATLAHAAPPTQSQRLTRLVEDLEQKRQQLHIPGMAIAIVQDDKIILARGFGVSDLENETPVTPETIFAIGSSTKAFTATLVGMLVDEGKMTWDDPATRHLPYFKLAIDTDDEDAVVTVRDLLSHRTGFARMGAIWAGGNISREDVLRTAIHAEPFAPFREKFYYNNVTYMAAGVCAEIASGGRTWENLIEERLFKPLGMESSNTTAAEAQADERLSLGYIWDEEKESYKLKPMRNVQSAAPAGSINSNVIDMAQWVRFQLGRGVIDGSRLLSGEQHAETWKKSIEIAGPVAYGMGWVLNEWNGQRVVEHGGNIDGFGAQVAMLPDSNLGYVLLTNVTATPLQGLSQGMVWEAMLGEWDTEDVAAEPGEFDEFLGKYIANYAQFRDSEFTVLVQNGNLAIDVPEQMTFELEPPDADGRRSFSLTDQIALSFDRDESGKVVAVRLYQAGLEFVVPRMGIEQPIEIPLDELKRYVGRYESSVLGGEVIVLIKSNHLAVDVPDQTAYELHPPDDEDQWVARAMSIVSIRFNEDDEGRIESLTMYQAGAEVDTLPLIAGDGEAAEPLPTFREIEALMRYDDHVDLWKRMTPCRINATVRLPQAGITGTSTTWVAGPDRYRADTVLGRFGYAYTAVDGDHGWNYVSFNPEPLDDIEGKMLLQAKLAHPASDWRSVYEKSTVLSAGTLDDRRVYLVRFSGGELPSTTIHVDAETGDVLKAESSIVLPGIGGLPVTTLFEDFRDVHGVRIAFRIISSNEATGRTVIQFESIDENVEFPEDLFTPPKSDGE